MCNKNIILSLHTSHTHLHSLYFFIFFIYIYIYIYIYFRDAWLLFGLGNLYNSSWHSYSDDAENLNTWKCKYVNIWFYWKFDKIPRMAGFHVLFILMNYIEMIYSFKNTLKVINNLKCITITFMWLFLLNQK